MSCRRLTFSYVSNFVPPSHSSIVMPAYFSVCGSAHNLLIMDFTIHILGQTATCVMRLTIAYFLHNYMGPFTGEWHKMLELWSGA